MDDLKFIEECKKLSLPLDTIRKKLELKKCHGLDEEVIEQQVDYVYSQIKQLNTELNDLAAALQQLNTVQKEKFSEKLASESLGLLQSLNLLTK